VHVHGTVMMSAQRHAIVGVPTAGHAMVSVQELIARDRPAHVHHDGLTAVVCCLEHSTTERGLLRSVTLWPTTGAL
jgi:hypothetical protein